MKKSVQNKLQAAVSNRTYFVAVTYNGQSGADVPSTLRRVNASSKAVAEKRAIAQARAEFPRYTAFTAVAETLTPRKIRHFNREFADMRSILEYLDKALASCKELRQKTFARINEVISGKTSPDGKLRYRRWQYWLRYDTEAIRRYERQLEEREFAWLLLLEMNEVINAK